MNVSVWDTYVKRQDGLIMHFDILVSSALTDEKTILNYGKQYLNKKRFQTGELSSNECQFCHIEKASIEVTEGITKNGYYIIEMENCT